MCACVYGHRARQAKFKTGTGLDEHRAYIHMELDGCRARLSLVGLSAHCTISYILQHKCEGHRNLQCALSPTKLCLALYLSSPMYVCPMLI